MSKAKTNTQDPDVTVELALESGRTRLSIAELMGMKEGSLIELGAMSGEPVLLTVEREVYAEAEVVAVADRFGARILKVVNAESSES